MSRADLIRGDRRVERRYECELPLRFSSQGSESALAGSGRTVDFGRKGIRFYSDDPPPRGATVELCIEWPFLLQDVCPLELMVWGRVLRCDAQGVVVRINRYEFRTCGERSFAPESPSAAAWSIVA